MTKIKESTTEPKVRKPRKAKATNTHTDTTSTTRTIIGKYAKMNTLMMYHESRQALAVIGESAEALVRDAGNARWNNQPLSSIENSHLANIYKKCKESCELYDELEMASLDIYGITFKNWVKYIKVESLIRKIKFLADNWFSTMTAITERGVEVEHQIKEQNLGIAASIKSHIANLKEDAEYAESEMARIFGLINELVEYPVGKTDATEYSAELDDLTAKHVERINEAIASAEAENNLERALAALFS